MVWNWIFKRLFTPERLASIIKNNQPLIAEAMKQSIHDVLNDEEIGEHLIAYTDGVYNRYLGKSGKLWSTIGGLQKGLNFAVNSEVDNLNPLSNLIDEEGNFSLANLVKGFLRGQINQTMTSQTPQQQINRNSGSVPLMQPVSR